MVSILICSLELLLWTKNETQEINLWIGIYCDIKPRNVVVDKIIRHSLGHIVFDGIYVIDNLGL